MSQTEPHIRRSERDEFLCLFDALIAFAEAHAFRGRRKVLFALRQVRRQGSLHG